MKHVMLMPNKPTLVEVYFSDPRTNEVYKDFQITAADDDGEENNIEEKLPDV